MMDDIKRALLGDHEAAERLTAYGKLLPCCGKPPVLQFHFGLKAWTLECAVNGHLHNTGFRTTKERAIRAWNALVPMWAPEQLRD